MAATMTILQLQLPANPAKP